MTLTREQVEQLRLEGPGAVLPEVWQSLCDLALAGVRSQWIPTEKLDRDNLTVLPPGYLTVYSYSYDDSGDESGLWKATLPEPPARKEGR